MSDKHVDVNNAFTEKYRSTLQRINQEGECPAPFCKDSAEYHEHGIDYIGRYWKVTRNTFNYQKAQHAFLIVHRQHITSFDELTTDDWMELYEIINNLRHEHSLKGSTFAFRFGEKSHTGATVTHLHCHLIVGYPKTENSEPIYFVTGYAPKE